MADITGVVRLTANSKEYRMFFGTTALAALCAKYGKNFLAELEGAIEAGGAGLDFGIVVDIYREALQRFHVDDLVADPYLPDDLFVQNADGMSQMMAAAFPDADGGQGNAQKVRKTRKPSTSPRGSRNTSARG
ncbi:hypothetical protein [Pararhodobacter zhoushanensis]|uniref:hypothetical protein n=1 Tax=Pararhodobacter zhoushanensis TaxID=2479545 RepID=UPI000F8F695D|nr:hypothetical protein [Pararhodobacter zhoushanensis]